MHSYVLVDTNVWHFAFVRPKEREFAEVHARAKETLERLLADKEVRIAMSSYQVGETLEVLRKSGVDQKTIEGLLEDFGTGKFFVEDLTFDAVKDATEDSASSGIHVYDYLVAYPLKHVTEKIYSADDHFQHRHFRYAEIVNPVAPWILREGTKPFKER